jgi:hypothetical protein
LITPACEQGRQSEALSLTKSFSFAPEARWKLAGGGTAGMPVIIALRHGRGAGSERKEKKLSYRRFHRRLISIALSGRKTRIAYLER